MHPEPSRLISLQLKRSCQEGYCGKTVACAAGNLVAVQAKSKKTSSLPGKLLIPRIEIVEARLLSP